MAVHDATNIILNSGNFVYVCVRHRVKTQTLNTSFSLSVQILGTEIAHWDISRSHPRRYTSSQANIGNCWSAKV